MNPKREQERRLIYCKGGIVKKIALMILIPVVSFLFSSTAAQATPTTLIWAPSTDIQPYKKVHLNIDNYSPVAKKGRNGTHMYVLGVYGPTFCLLSDRAEAGFDYKKGLGSVLDKYPVYFHFKLGVPEGAYLKNMPALALGAYDMGTKHDKTDNNVWYMRAAKTFKIGDLNLGRLSAGYFNGNARLLRDKNGLRDNSGPMFAWERVMPEISDRLWLCVDYQGTQSAYGALNMGFSWKFSNNLAAILGYDIYNNPNLRNTVTCQLDCDF